MKLDGFKPAAYEVTQQEWLQKSPYAALVFISWNGRVSRSRLFAVLDRLGLSDSATGSQLAVNIIDCLLKRGDIQLLSDIWLASMPPYAVQKNPEEWSIHGDARVDKIFNRFMREHSAVFEVQSCVNETQVSLERILLVESTRALPLIEQVGIRAFQLHELLDLIPEAASITEPLPWPRFEPGAYTSWQFLDEYGRWNPVQSLSQGPLGVYRGLATDDEGRIVAEKYFFRHADGWSPLTSDDARLWVFKTAARGQHPVSCEYDLSTKTLKISRLVPHGAYMALRYLSSGIRLEGSNVVVRGLDRESAEVVCQRLVTHLVVRG